MLLLLLLLMQLSLLNDANDLIPTQLSSCCLPPVNPCQLRRRTFSLQLCFNVPFSFSNVLIVNVLLKQTAAIEHSNDSHVLNNSSAH